MMFIVFFGCIFVSYGCFVIACDQSLQAIEFSVLDRCVSPGWGSNFGSLSVVEVGEAACSATKHLRAPIREVRGMAEFDIRNLPLAEKAELQCTVSQQSERDLTIDIKYYAADNAKTIFDFQVPVRGLVRRFTTGNPAFNDVVGPFDVTSAYNAIARTSMPSLGFLMTRGPPAYGNSIVLDNCKLCLEFIKPPEAVCNDFEEVVGSQCAPIGISPSRLAEGSSGDSIFVTTRPSGPYNLGKTSVEVTVRSTRDGTFDRCFSKVEVIDNTPPKISCPLKDISPPKAPISFAVEASDNCGVPTVEVTSYDCWKFTKKGKRIDKTGSCVVRMNDEKVEILDSGGVGTFIGITAVATDGSGNTAGLTIDDCVLQVQKP